MAETFGAQDRPWKWRAVESEENQRQVFAPFPPPLEIAKKRDFHIPTATTAILSSPIQTVRSEPGTLGLPSSLRDPILPADAKNQMLSLRLRPFIPTTNSEEAYRIFAPFQAHQERFAAQQSVALAGFTLSLASRCLAIFFILSLRDRRSRQYNEWYWIYASRY